MGKYVDLIQRMESNFFTHNWKMYYQRDVGDSLHAIRGHFQVAQDVPRGEGEMNEDAKGENHMPLHNWDSGGLRLVVSYWGIASTHKANVIGTKYCLQGVIGIFL